MASFNIVEINKQFPGLFNRVEVGEEIILKKSGKLIARIVPIQRNRRNFFDLDKICSISTKFLRVWINSFEVDEIPASLNEFL